MSRLTTLYTRLYICIYTLLRKEFNTLNISPRAFIAFRESMRKIKRDYFNFYRRYMQKQK